MKTLIIIASIFVSAHGKQIKLSPAELATLQAKGNHYVHCTLAHYKNGGTIRNNEAADEIFQILGK